MSSKQYSSNGSDDYLNRLWLDYRRIYASLGVNELNYDVKWATRLKDGHSIYNGNPLGVRLHLHIETAPRSAQKYSNIWGILYHKQVSQAGIS